MSSLLLQIVRKEMKTYFSTPIPYIVAVVFLTATGYLFFNPFFLIGRADVRDFFSLLPLLFMLVIPAITMRLFAEEFSSGSYEILYTLPVTALDVLLAKFISALIFVMVMLAPTISYPLWISGIGNIDWGPVVGGYIGALLLAMLYCTIGIFASSLTKNQIVSLIIALAICFILFIVDKIIIFAPGFLGGFLQFLSADFHFRNIARGIIDTRDLVYFLSLSTITLYGTYLVIREKQ